MSFFAVFPLVLGLGVVLVALDFAGALAGVVEIELA
jgi:hypothetical protein